MQDRRLQHSVRDQRVRDAMLDLAGGRCQHCGVQAIESQIGGRYFETHHNIGLAAE